MDRHAEWIEARHKLSEASKTAHLWDTMPSDLRSRMGMVQYRQKRAVAHRRLKQADKLCRAAAAANRASLRIESRI